MPGEIDMRSVALTESLLQLPYFLDPATQDAHLATVNYDQRLPEPLDKRRLIHTGLLRLVAAKRLHERQTAWAKEAEVLLASDEADMLPELPATTELPAIEAPVDSLTQIQTEWSAAWRNRWEFTEERRSRVLKRHPLALRKAGRQLVLLYNAERTDEPTERVSFAALCNDETNPDLLDKHLKQAGYMPSRAKTRDARQYPADAALYVEYYPAPLPPQGGEKNRFDIQKKYRISYRTVMEVIDDLDIGMVVRRFSGRGGRESEYLTAEDVARLEYAIENMPRMDPEQEIPLTSLVDEWGSLKLLMRAWRLSGVNAPVKLLGGTLNKGRCVQKDDLTQLRRWYEYITTKMPWEYTYDDIARMSGYAHSTVTQIITPEQIATARKISVPTGATKGLYVFPVRTAQEMLIRLMGTNAPSLSAQSAIPAGERVFTFGFPKAMPSQESIRKSTPPQYHWEGASPEPRQLGPNQPARVYMSLEDIALSTGAPLRLVTEIANTQRGLYAPTDHEFVNRRKVELFSGAFLDAILVEIVGLNIQQMARRSGATEEHITRFIYSRGFHPNDHGSYSAGVWERVRTEFRQPPQNYVRISPAETSPSGYPLLFLAAQLGITVEYFYTGDDTKQPYVSSGSYDLLGAQFTGEDPDGRPYAQAENGWCNRYELSTLAGCSLAEVDEWIETNLTSRKDMQLARCRERPAPDVIVLPHINRRQSSLCILNLKKK